MTVLIKNILSKTVATIKKEQPVFEAVEIMSKKRISCLVVVKNDNALDAIGIITNRDIIERIVAKRLNAEKIKVDNIMSSPVKTITSKDNLFYASTIMNGSSIKQLPVVDNGKLAGIVTQTDIVRHTIDMIF